MSHCFFLASSLSRLAILCPSQVQIPALPNTATAPTDTPSGRLFPNSQMLANRLTNFRTLRAIVTPTADVRAARMLTPRMQTYCVRAFNTRLTMCFGIVTLRIEGASSIGGSCPSCVISPAFGNSNVGCFIRAVSSTDVELTSCRNWLRRDGKNGAKSGMERK